MTAGASIRSLRLTLGLSLLAVANDLGVSVSTVRDAERTHRLRPATADRYLASLSRLARLQADERVRRQTEAVLAVTNPE